MSIVNTNPAQESIVIYEQELNNSIRSSERNGFGAEAKELNEWVISILGDELFQELKPIQLIDDDNRDYAIWVFPVRGCRGYLAQASLMIFLRDYKSASLEITFSPKLPSGIEKPLKSSAFRECFEFSKDEFIRQIEGYYASVVAWDRLLLEGDSSKYRINSYLTSLGFNHEWMNGFHLEFYRWKTGGSEYFVETEDFKIVTFGVSFLELPTLTGQTVLVSPQKAIIEKLLAYNNQDLLSISKDLVIEETVLLPRGFTWIRLPFADPFLLENKDCFAGIEYSFLRPIDKVAEVVCIRS